VTAADNKADAGVDGRVVSHAAGVDVSFHVIDCDQWDIECECDGFGGGESDQQRTDKSGFCGNGDCGQLFGRACSLLKCGRDDREDSADMGA